MTVKIHIVYWGAWGYEPKFRKLKTELERSYPGQVAITGEGTPTVTGFFEVEVAGKLIHSKKNGDGYVDSGSKKDKINNAIKSALN